MRLEFHALALGADEAHCQRGRVGRAKVPAELCHESLVGRCGCGHGRTSWAQMRSQYGWPQVSWGCWSLPDGAAAPFFRVLNGAIRAGGALPR